MNAVELFTEIPAHPATELFPTMTDAELLALADDIQEHGLLEPITMFEGRVLDGRNRLAACKISGVAPRFEEWGPHLGDLPTKYVLARNLPRRSWTFDERVAIAAKSIPLLQADIRRWRILGTPRPDPRRSILGAETREWVAHFVDVSTRSVRAAFEAMRRQEDKAAGLDKPKRQRADPAEPPRICSIEGCDRKARPVGLCNMHYQRKRATGDAGPAYGRKMAPASHYFLADRIQQITELAAQGFNSEQIGAQIKMRGQRVRELARENHIDLRELTMGKVARKINLVRVIRETVSSAEGFVITTDMVGGQIGKLTVDEAELQHWCLSLDESVQTLNKLLKLLKGKLHEKQKAG